MIDGVGGIGDVERDILVSSLASYFWGQHIPRDAKLLAEMAIRGIELTTANRKRMEQTLNEPPVARRDIQMSIRIKPEAQAAWFEHCRTRPSNAFRSYQSAASVLGSGTGVHNNTKAVRKTPRDTLRLARWTRIRSLIGALVWCGR